MTAGASAPPALVDEVVAALRAYGPVVVEERETARDTIRIRPPTAGRAASESAFVERRLFEDLI